MIVNAKHDVSKLDKSKLFDARKYGFSFSESAIFQLHKNDYREYITTWEAYQPRLDKHREYFVISDDKLLFSAVMRNYIETADIFATIVKGEVNSFCDSTLNKFNLYDFFLENDGGVIKDRNGYNGFGVYVFYPLEDSLMINGKPISRAEFLKTLSRTQDGLVQKRLVQGSFENKIFDKSVNTIRMITMQKSNSTEHEVVAACQRIGTNRTNGVDNFSQGGGSALIDIKTGKLSAMTMIDSFDDEGNRLFYSKHPDTDAQIEGLVIPKWEDIKTEIIEITKKLPFFKYVAWDIVLKDEGIALIETNMKSSLGIFQSHGGMRNSFLGQKYKEHGYIKE